MAAVAIGCTTSAWSSAMPTTTANTVMNVEPRSESCWRVTGPLALSCCSRVVALVMPVNWYAR